VTIERGRTIKDLQRFIALNEASRRRLGVPSQPARFFHNLWETAHDGNAAEIWVASHLGKDLAAVFLLLDGETAYYKWSARSHSETRGAGHLLVWSIVESLRGNYRTLDLGRTDARNDGLNRFKRELGGTHSPLPYSFVPRAPTEISPEHVHGSRRLIGAIWKHLPPALCGLLSDRLYKYLA
jgi:hypothetical protein